MPINPLEEVIKRHKQASADRVALLKANLEAKVAKGRVALNEKMEQPLLQQLSQRVSEERIKEQEKQAGIQQKQAEKEGIQDAGPAVVPPTMPITAGNLSPSTQGDALSTLQNLLPGGPQPAGAAGSGAGAQRSQQGLTDANLALAGDPSVAGSGQPAINPQAQTAPAPQVGGNLLDTPVTTTTTEPRFPIREANLVADLLNLVSLGLIPGGTKTTTKQQRVRDTLTPQEFVALGTREKENESRKTEQLANKVRESTSGNIASVLLDAGVRQGIEPEAIIDNPSPNPVVMDTLQGTRANLQELFGEERGDRLFKTSLDSGVAKARALQRVTTREINRETRAAERRSKDPEVQARQAVSRALLKVEKEGSGSLTPGERDLLQEKANLSPINRLLQDATIDASVPQGPGPMTPEAADAVERMLINANPDGTPPTPSEIRAGLEAMGFTAP